MKIGVFLISVLALLPFAAEAQRGSAGGHATSGGHYSAPARGNYQTRPAARPQQGQAVARNPQPFGSNRIGPIAPRPFPNRNEQLRRGYSIPITTVRRPIWWGGGLYLGIGYAPGWYYYPAATLPGYWYGNSQMAYRYDSEPYIMNSGVKFDLAEIAEADRRAVEDGLVYLSEKGGEKGYLGSVKDFSGKRSKALPLDPGNYDILVALADGREFDMRSIIVQTQRVTKVELRFDKAPAEEKQTAGTLPNPVRQGLTPAPPPKP